MIGHRVARFGGAVYFCVSVAGSTAAAPDCGRKVEAAFQRLQTSGRPYRIETDRQGRAEILEFVPPDRMRLKYRIREGDEWAEFVRVGNRVWDHEKELPGDLANVFDEQTKRLGRPFGAFECLGPVRFSGKAYTRYRTYQVQSVLQPGQPRWRERAFWRTVLVDPKSGELAYEIATPEQRLDNLIWRKHYTYPNDMAIDPPVQ